MTSSVSERVFLLTSASLEVPGRRHCFRAAYIKTTSSRPIGLEGVVNKNKRNNVLQCSSEACRTLMKFPTAKHFHCRLYPPSSCLFCHSPEALTISFNGQLVEITEALAANDFTSVSEGHRLEADEQVSPLRLHLQMYSYTKSIPRWENDVDSGVKCAFCECQAFDLRCHENHIAVFSITRAETCRD